MFDAIYLVTVFNNRTRKLAQKLITGGFDKAVQLRDIICGNVFNGDLRHLTSSIAEIKNNEVKCYLACDPSCFFSYDRILDNDFYLFHIYENYNHNEDAYNTQVGFAETASGASGSKEAVIKLALSKRLSGLSKCAINKISFRGISFVAVDGTETMIEFAEIKYDEADAIYIDENIDIVKI